MKNILFATDLDNTLIHSYKTKTDSDICVEYLNDKEQSFMSKYTYENLISLNEKIRIMLVTTRSIQQYNRINLPIKNNRAITTNGAVLLDNELFENTLCLYLMESTLENKQHLEQIEQQLKNHSNLIYKYVDGIYLYAVCENSDVAENLAKSIKYSNDITVDTSGRKVYFIPNDCTKGKALAKIKNDCFVIAAGDSRLDLSMLNVADVAIIPKSLKPLIKNKNIKVCPDDMLFSDFIVDTLKLYLN